MRLKTRKKLLKTNAKVQFESNSQQRTRAMDIRRYCWRPMRRYNLKAIHNSHIRHITWTLTVEDQCEGTIWKQFTTGSDAGCRVQNCWRPMRRYNLKAIHNKRSRLMYFKQLLKTNAKVQFESNSQQCCCCSLPNSDCWRPMRRYNLKAIHNIAMSGKKRRTTVEDQCEGTIWKQFTTGGQYRRA